MGIIRRWLFNQFIEEAHERMRSGLSEKAWIIKGNTGTSLDLACNYCGIGYHINSGQHKNSCPYSPDFLIEKKELRG